MQYTTWAGRWTRSLLFLLGCLGFLVGIGVSAYAVFAIRPRIVAVNDQLHSTIQSLDRATAALSGSSRVLNAPLDVLKAGGQAARQLPETLTSLKGTLFEASNALIASGKTVKETTQGVSGLVVPKSELSGTNVYLQATGEQLRLLGSMVGNLSVATGGLSTSLGGLSGELTRLGAELGPTQNRVQAVRNRLQSADQLLSYLNLPFQVTLLGLGLGGMYLMLGLFSLGFALALPAAAVTVRPEEAAGPAQRPLRRAV